MLYPTSLGVFPLSEILKISHTTFREVDLLPSSGSHDAPLLNTRRLGSWLYSLLQVLMTFHFLAHDVSVIDYSHIQFLMIYITLFQSHTFIRKGS
jgi:hypothetical protein